MPPCSTGQGPSQEAPVAEDTPAAGSPTAEAPADANAAADTPAAEAPAVDTAGEAPAASA